VGKSTLFHCILGLQARYQGSIRINDREANTLSAKELAHEIAFIPQMQKSTFHFSVLDMVLMGTTAQLSLLQQPGETQLKQARAALARFGIGHLAERDFEQLSGGESQLTLIARAIAQGAKILLLDEPTASLDYGNSLRVMEEIRRLAKEGFTILFSTHDPNQALSYATQVLALYEGNVAAFGPTNLVLQPALLEQLYQISVRFETIGEEQHRICIPLPRKDD
jgi:iron complex transport system ATP-binding protein